MSGQKPSKWSSQRVLMRDLNLFASRPLVTLIQHVEESNRHCRDLSLFASKWAKIAAGVPPRFSFRVVVGDMMHHVDYTGALWCRFHVLICVPVHKWRFPTTQPACDYVCVRCVICAHAGQIDVTFPRQLHHHYQFPISSKTSLLIPYTASTLSNLPGTDNGKIFK